MLTPQELQSHVDLVGVRLELISRKYDRFGWDNISAEVRSMLKADWNDKLMDYSIDEIDAAISDYVDDVRNKKAAHEGQIKAIIIANRQRVVASQQKPVEPEPERIQATAEQRQAIIDEVNFSGDVKVKTFTGMDFRTVEEGFGEPIEKPEERE